MALPMPSDASTTSGAIALGSRWRTMMRGALAPSVRAAQVYSSSRRTKTTLRATRAYVVQYTSARAIKTLVRPGPRTATMAIARTITGNAWNTSTRRMISESQKPPR